MSAFTKEEIDFLPRMIYAIEKNETWNAAFEPEEDVIAYKILNKLHDSIKELQHHKDTTTGLWATDKKPVDKTGFYRIE